MSKKYSKMKKKIWETARGGILTSMILVGSTIGGSAAYAQSLPDSAASSVSSRTPSGMHVMHRYNSPAKINSLLTQLGLNSQAIKDELKNGKPLKQVLIENGIAIDELDQ